MANLVEIAILTKNTICIVLVSLDGLFWLLAIIISIYAEIKFRKEEQKKGDD